MGAGRAEASGELTLQVISSRADMASSGNALVQVTVPSPARLDRLKVTQSGGDVTGRFRPAGTPPGPVRSFPIDDPELAPWRDCRRGGLD